MSPFLNAVTIEVGTDAHAIAVGTGVERWGIESDCTIIDGIIIMDMPVNIKGILPICGFDISNIWAKTELINGRLESRLKSLQLKVFLS